MSHKVHSNAWGEDLPDETRRQIYAYTKPPTAEERKAGRPWLRRYHEDVLPYLSLQGIPAPSAAGWYRFLGRMREQEAAQTIISVETSKRIAQGIQSAEIDYRLAADMMTALSIDAAAKGNGEAAKILGVTAAKYAKAALGEEKLKLDAARQKTADEQLKLAREKFEAAEKRLNAVQGAVDAPQLSDAERVAKIKSIFGMR